MRLINPLTNYHKNEKNRNKNQEIQKKHRDNWILIQHITSCQ
jgi:hypothetical protein